MGPELSREPSSALSGEPKEEKIVRRKLDRLLNILLLIFSGAFKKNFFLIEG